MEFVLESFQAEVTAALQDEPSPPKRPRLDEVDTPQDKGEDVAEWECPADYEQWLDYPAYEGRQTSPPVLTVRDDSPQPGNLITIDNDSSVENIDEPEDTIPAFFHPDLDMTTAIEASNPCIQPIASSDLSPHGENFSLSFGLGRQERLDLVPNFYSYAIKATLMPIRRVQHELVMNYFQYIHPMFPVVDEHYFTKIYRKYRGQEQYMDPEDFMIYQAITAAGFGHLSEAQLQRTPYRSVHEGQEAQFDQVKARYWSQTTTDPVVLTQICLIISLWSPGAAGAQNNSYWLNLAFKQATAGELWKAQPNVDRRCRRRLLWWCCLVRDRVLALGMRRPYRLHKAPFQEKLITELDFGLEATSPAFTDIESKRISILAFVWLCKLSEIMAAIAVFQRRNRFSRDWNGESVGSSTSELKEVTVFDRDLTNWKEAFEDDVVKLMDQGNQDLPVAFTILRIVCNCLLAVLYQPYLHLSWSEHTSEAEIDVDPLQRMKEGAQAVESSVVVLISNNKSDTLPNWLVSWVTLPAAVYHVNQHVQINSAPDKVLMPFLNRFMRRTTGAQAMFLTLTRATKEFLQRLNDNHSRGNLEFDSKTFGRRIAPSVKRLDHVDSALNMGNRITEAKILAHVTKALDFALELRC